MLKAIKVAGKKLFEAFGLEIRKKNPQEQPPRASLPGALGQLKKMGFRPRTVIDVGVATQTEGLYPEFPEAEFLLIEPQAEFEPSLKRICSEYKGQYVLAAAGAKPGTAVLNVHTDQMHSSSLLREVEGLSVDGVPRNVPVVTIDQVCEEKGLKAPYLLKLDVQGAELQVLQGANETLEKSEAIILEVTWWGTMIGGPQLYDVVSWMKAKGFVAYDICGTLYRPLDGALAQTDFVFVKENGMFRECHAFATPEQRKAMAWREEELAALKAVVRS